MTSTVEGVDSGAEERGETKSLHSGSVRSPPEAHSEAFW
jgi:hypothetical protein